MNQEDFIEKSKKLHRHYSKEFWAGAFDPSHPDTKRHYELLSSSDGLLSHLSPSTILSVGDNLGRDAGYFKRKFPDSKCIASDLYAEGIIEAVSRQFLDDVISADIEKLPFSDNEIDCVIAKEAFHHWPRPMLGMYEMLRVARKAILLIEPYDVAKQQPQPFLNRDSYSDEYESVGNYKYQISLREILKSAWSLYYPAVAAVGFNDPYKIDYQYDEWLQEKKLLDEMGYNGNRQFNLMAIAIYKTGYEPSLPDLPAQATLYLRPRNPFLNE
jgi:SAM-dependent methyltransferase